MESIQATAIFPAIAPDGAAEFKQLAGDLLELVATEPGTIQYDWFFSQDGRRCVVRETYASSDAVLEHLGHVGSMLGRLVELGGGFELEVFGAPSQDLTDAISAFNPNVYSYAQGK